MAGERVVLIARDSGATRLLYHALSKRFNVHVLLEEPPSTLSLLKSRAKRLGWPTVIGQVLFQLLIAKPQARASRGRIGQIIAAHDASTAPIPAQHAQPIGSVNSEACLRSVRAIGPAAVVINGTRILKAMTIRTLAVPVINTHVGITPMYRGVHGAYWALTQNDRAHCGVTIHFVDAGIDTGAIISQALIEPTPADNFSTYPMLQMTAGAPLLVKAVEEVITGTVQVRTAHGPSRRWNHPTLLQYLAYRIREGVK